MRIWLNKHFGFSKGELNGLILLILIIVLLKAFPLIYNYYKQVDKDEPVLLASIKKIAITDGESSYYNRERIENSVTKAKSRLFKFDPNKISSEEWQTLGLSPKQAQSIVNYRNKGGKFYKVEDLQKMYTISPAMYKKLLPYVIIENPEPSFAKTNFQYEKKEYVKKVLAVVDLNQADSAGLDQIKGIGPAFANRILKYRERLGGFYKKEQLLEVYGLDSVKYNEIKD